MDQGPANQEIGDLGEIDLLELLENGDFEDIVIPSGSEEGMSIKDVLGDGSLGRIRDAVMVCNMYDMATPEGPPEQLQARDELLSYLLDLVPNDVSDSRYPLRIAVPLARQLFAETDTTEAGRRRRGHRANNCSVALGHLYWAGGDPKHLDDAIGFSEKAFTCSETAKQILRGLPVAASVLESDDAVHILNTLAARLSERFELAGSLVDLNYAIRIMERLVCAVLQSGWEHLLTEWPGNLSAYLHRRYEQDESGSTDDVDRAIELAEMALAVSESRGDGQVVTALCTLAHPLGGRALATGSTDDLDEALTYLRRAQSITAGQQPRSAEIGFNLAMRLHQKSQMAADPVAAKEARDGAIKMAQRTLETAPADHTLRTHLHNLIGMLIYAQFMQQRSEPPETGADVRLALTHLWSALTSPQSLSVLRRVQVGRMILDLCCATEQWRAAYHAAVAATALIPKLSSRAVRNQDKQRLLGNEDVVGFGADAAAAALNADEDGYAAVRLLEASRGSLASSIAELRTDLAELRGQHPDLAERFAELRDKLQSNSPRRHDANRDFDALLEQIRGKPNFGDFLQIPSRAQMQEAAREGPIVVLTASHYRGVDAILVEENDIRVLPLVGISTADLEERLRSDSDMDSPELLGWLWDSIAEKVLYALGLTEPMPPDELPPRVWWVLTGMVGRFPLHAAGHHSHGSTNSVMDRAVSSYTTSIRALVKARRDALAPPSKALLISAANTPACRSLRHAADEIKEVGVLLASKDIGSIPLEDSHAGKQKVLGHLAACQIFHYAGHGLEHPSDPLRSALLLHDWKVDTMTVSDVLDLNLTQARPFLAYLSACETGQASNQRLQDESIHLVGAYQLAGFRHVVGTLWSVYDRTSVEMATMTYQNLLRGAMTDDSVSRGLHKAAWQLRRLGIEGGSDAGERKVKVSDSQDELDAGGWEDERDRKSRSWVPFAHFGV